jgi:chitin synthase
MCLPDYIAFVPTYIHLLIIYAFCRIDDFSWGTKGIDSKTNSDS